MIEPDFIEAIGLPLLAHRLRRVSEAIVGDVGELLRRQDIQIPPRAGSLVMLLEAFPGLSVMVAAQRLGLSHTMVINLAGALSKAGLVEDASDPRDSRRRLLRLTGLGRQQALFLGELNRALSGAFEEMFEEAKIDLLAALHAFERAAARHSVLERTAALLAHPSQQETSS